MEDYYRWQHKLVINKTAVLYVGQMTTKYRICRLYLEKKTYLVIAQYLYTWL